LADLTNLVINTRHAANATASKDECLVIGDLIHNIHASQLNPPANWGTVIDCDNILPKTVDKVIRFDPWEIGHVCALKSQLSAWFIILC
jgi:hypothetical protein